MPRGPGHERALLPGTNHATMKILKSKTLPTGRVRFTVEIAPDERLQAVCVGGFYRLGGQVNDIVQSHVIEEMRRVRWCSITQEWIEE